MTVDSRCAVLMEYADDRWRKRIVCGEAAVTVERWLADVERRPRLPGRASGKPLAWLHLAEDRGSSLQRLVATRSVGLLTDVLRGLERTLAAEDFQALRAIFDRDGQPFQGEIEPA